MNREGPIVEELCPPPDAEQAFLRLRGLPHCLWLDSALKHATLGRYSFLTADPFAYLELAVSDRGAFEQLGRRVSELCAPAAPGVPPFQGGAAGLFCYDLAQQVERLPAPRRDEFQIPALAVGFYDVVLAWDHAQNRAWFVSQGFPAPNGQRRRRAVERIAQFRDWLVGPPRAAHRQCRSHSLTRDELAPQFRVGDIPYLTSSFSRDDYLQAVQQAIEYIAAGDIFQVNLSQRLLYPSRDDATELYLRLRHRNAATFAGYFDLGAFQIASASPERFLQVHDRQVEARPIKGTRRRTRLAEADLFAGDELRASEKDRAENVMIVDLLRNDLARVCQPESVRVTQLCELESYEFVQHLVSAVRGTLADGRQPLDLLRAAFPGGSITGAPKVRAMEIIAELEPTARGAYCGALGYLGFDGTMDTSILIRTVTAGRGWWQFPVGGGVVAQSEPAREYDETWHKAEGLLRALR